MWMDGVVAVMVEEEAMMTLDSDEEAYQTLTACYSLLAVIFVLMVARCGCCCSPRWTELHRLRILRQRSFLSGRGWASFSSCCCA